jgi:acyl-CoA reductase-like NAD-dependent aldehyde dehydrogenase
MARLRCHKVPWPSSTQAEVIELANDTTYGLAAGIFTKDYERAICVTGAMQAGTIWTNMFNFVHWSMPFGLYSLSFCERVIHWREADVRCRWLQGKWHWA